MTKWRPEGWENPYVRINKISLKYYGGHPFDAVEESAYEAGADAMLEALIKQHGVKIGKDEWTDDSTFQTDSDGILVSFLIPDEVQS